jgi:hypothetical protein
MPAMPWRRTGRGHGSPPQTPVVLSIPGNASPRSRTTHWRICAPLEDLRFFCTGQGSWRCSISCSACMILFLFHAYSSRLWNKYTILAAFWWGGTPRMDAERSRSPAAESRSDAGVYAVSSQLQRLVRLGMLQHPPRLTFLFAHSTSMR